MSDESPNGSVQSSTPMQIVWCRPQSDTKSRRPNRTPSDARRAATLSLEAPSTPSASARSASSTSVKRSSHQQQNASRSYPCSLLR